MKLKGTPYFWLDSVSWRKPGVLEIRISEYVLFENVFKDAKVPAVKDFFNAPPGVRPQLEGYETGWRDGYYTRTWVFREGVESPRSPRDSSPAYKGAHAEQWSISATVMQVPIETHPNLKAIIKAGGGVFSDGRLEFPRYLGEIKNPWYGTTDFLFPSVMVSVELPPVGEALDFSTLQYLGTTDFAPQGAKSRSGDRAGAAETGFPAIDNVTAMKNRKPWLFINSSAVKRGRKLIVRRQWSWGGRAGWADPIYKSDWTSDGGTGAGILNGATGAK
jgi:hypothetical protein